MPAIGPAGAGAPAWAPAARVAAALVTAGLLTGRLVPAAGRLVLTTPVPAPAVATLRLARRGLPRLSLLASALRRAARLLGTGLLGPAVRPFSHGRLVEAELLPGFFLADPATPTGAQA